MTKRILMGFGSKISIDKRFGFQKSDLNSKDLSDMKG